VSKDRDWNIPRITNQWNPALNVEQTVCISDKDMMKSYAGVKFEQAFEAVGRIANELSLEEPARTKLDKKCHKFLAEMRQLVEEAENG